MSVSAHLNQVNPVNPVNPPPPMVPSSASLYVGDLNPNVTEQTLAEIFNTIGNVISIRVCKDISTGRSLGYAYVNYTNAHDAERALDTLNYHLIHDRPCRIMWSHRDPSIRKSNVGNIFIKGLDPSIDNKELYDTFSRFGNILSCKVKSDDSNKSKGYGFVHFDSEAAADNAIREANGKVIKDKKIYVGKFERHDIRYNSSQYTNIYIKNLPLNWADQDLLDYFKSYGSILSAHVSLDENKKSKGFGFVNFEKHEVAHKVVNGGPYLVEGTSHQLIVTRFQKKIERHTVLTKKYDALRRERNEKYRNLNLYVKNLEDNLDDAGLKEVFSPYGEITSAVVMKDENGVSKGFGFVCYNQPESATKALTELNGKMIGSKPILVSRAQPREERRPQLEAHFHAAMTGQRFPPFQIPYYPPSMNMGVPPHALYPAQTMNNRMPAARSNVQARSYPHQVMTKQRQTRGGGRNQNTDYRGRETANRNAYRFTHEAQQRHQEPPLTNVIDSHKQTTPVVQNMQTIEEIQLLKQTLASTGDEEQMKQILGNKLFPLVSKVQPSLASKITGMFLEMDTSEIMLLIVSPDHLKVKIDEAMKVLKIHQSSEHQSNTQ